MENTDKSRKIKNFTDLHAWKEAHALVLLIYSTTEKLPEKEQFGLTSQLRRAAISITSNIAEGFSRQSWKEKIKFYSISLGSLSEAESQLIIARDLKYISAEQCNAHLEKITVISKLLNGLIKSSRAMILDS